MTGPGLNVGGIQPLTTLDFPGKLAAVVFCQGCPWRCRYCHNQHLRSFAESSEVSWEDLMRYLGDRVGFLDAIVFSGGEPTAQLGLKSAMGIVRRMGFAIGLHTAGIFPDRLEQVLREADWVGMDVKAPLDFRYDRVTGIAGSAERVRRSLDLLAQSGVAAQIRTTVDPDLLSDGDVDEIDRELDVRGLPPTVRQACRKGGVPSRASADCVRDPERAVPLSEP